MGKKRNANGILVRKPLGRPRQRWEDNIKVDQEKQVGVVCTGFILLRIGTSEGLL
jgi:hypothetical protein